MKKRILLFSILLILFSVLVTAFFSVRFTISSIYQEQEKYLETYGAMIQAVIADEETAGNLRSMPEYARLFADRTGLRVTLIDENGTVLGDSRAGEAGGNMDNHLDREEVQEALDLGNGAASRRSSTLEEEYLYVAVADRLPDGRRLVTRLAMEIDSIQLVSSHVTRVAVFSSLVGVALAVILAFVYSGRLMQPVRKMERQLARTMAENRRAENIRREFVANVTHELKTPLTSIAGFVETLQAGAAEEPAARSKFLDIIAVETARLERLIEDILVISDIENKREMSGSGDVVIAQAVGEVIDALGPVAAARGISIDFTCTGEMHIGGSYDRFKQMIMNLIENAVKYSHDGGRVRVQAEMTGDGKACIRVSDQGIGISAGHLPRLFERFYRVDKSRSQKDGGTGLGLAIVKHIATLFEAEVSVESEPGKGTTFTVLFPPEGRRRQEV